MRDNREFVWGLASSAGIITFPSGHAAVAVLCGWAAWTVPWARLPAVVLNIAMALSTIPSGSHYLIDVIAGTLVALASIAAVRASTRRQARSFRGKALASA